ncbi:MAG: hypothetical protein ACOCUU_03785 [Nanoarchaeota archaeon]
MLLKKCPNKDCKKNYTLKEKCPSCNSKTKDAHYKFIKIRNAPKSNNINKIRKN